MTIRFRRYQRAGGPLVTYAMVIDDNLSAFSWQWRCIRWFNDHMARLLRRTRFDVVIADAKFVREYWD